jgi:hypothetical protein
MPAEDFMTVQKEVSDILSNRILVGHALHNDLKVSQFLDEDPCWPPSLILMGMAKRCYYDRQVRHLAINVDRVYL